MQLGRRLPLIALLAAAVVHPASSGAQASAPREGFSVALGAAAVAATSLDGVRPQPVLALRFVAPASPLVLRADAVGTLRAREPHVATVALGVRVVQLSAMSAYLLGGVGSYGGLHSARGGRNAGGGIELRPAVLKGRAAFVEGRAHAYFWSNLEGRHTERLTTVVAGLWW